ncbi:MAG: ferredoxin [Planctomycetota bacterium]|nr:MAG: ferredoxin [Planctomycetota bacterium]
MEVFVKVAKTSEIKLNGSVSIRTDNQFIAVGNNNGKYFAVSDICPHAGAPLGGGWIEDDCIVCPFHCWKFNVNTGECPHIEGEFLKVFEIKIEDEDIYVKIPKS